MYLFGCENDFVGLILNFLEKLVYSQGVATEL